MGIALVFISIYRHVQHTMLNLAEVYERQNVKWVCFHCHHILAVTQHKMRSFNDTALDDITVKPACLRSKAAK